MEIADFARQILLAPNLVDKLVQPGVFSDTQPGRGLAVPPAPARTPDLRLQPPGTKARSRFPSRGDLLHAESRGVVLHFFANHELLALELMALALLRFPEAPPRFRRGLVGTMLEEQRHLQLYCRRMEALGVGFGSVPVNRYFWDVIAGTPSPLAFVTQMSLTLEQANLDFSWHFQEEFTAVGDTATAAILDCVYREEIGHVQHGLQWFNAWRPAGETDWQAYKRLLPLPLTPQRAKGSHGYDVAGRRAAGLSESFIAELAVYSHSRGRPPRLYWFNPGCEQEVASAGKGRQPTRFEVQLSEDLASLMLFLAEADDVVWTPRRPTTEFLSRLRAAHFRLPQFVQDPAEIAGRLFASFEPWGQTGAAQAFLASLQVTLQQPFNLPPDPQVFAKSWAKVLYQALAPQLNAPEERGDGAAPAVWGCICRDLATATAEIAAILAGRGGARGQSVVVKAPLGAAGRASFRVLQHEQLGPEKTRWMQRILAEQGALIIEPWLEKIADFSVQIVVSPPLAAARGKVLGRTTRFLTDSRGQYLGHRLGKSLSDLPPSVVRAFHEMQVPERLAQAGLAVEKALAASGYRGPAGIDALLYQKPGGGIGLYPVVEVNSRFTMGAVALAIEQRVLGGVPALWLHLARRAVQAAGYRDFAAFAAQMAGDHPVRMRGQLIAGGMLPTNDPDTAQVVLTLLCVGEAACKAGAAFSRLPAASPTSAER